MNSETINALVNLGSAGAVIVVVIVFLKSIKERDAEWRNFFMALHNGDENANKQMTDVLNNLVASVNLLRERLEDHDQKVDQRIDQVANTRRIPRK